MVRDNPNHDPLHLLGQLISNKYVAVALTQSNKCTLTYEILQRVVERPLTMYVVRPEIYRQKGVREIVYAMANRGIEINQQNIPIILEVVDLKERNTIFITCDAIHGTDLPGFLRTHLLDPIAVMHIIHQILQIGAALHKKNIIVPHISMQNMTIMTSGSDPYFVRVHHITEAVLAARGETYTALDNVSDFGQIVLSLLTNKPIPVTSLELPGDRAYLLPTAQLFMRAIAPPPQRISSCIELLEAFEMAFDLNANDHEKPSCPLSASLTSKQKSQNHVHPSVPFEQVIFMHRAPHPCALDHS